MSIDNFKIFWDGNVRQCLENCLSEGYIPLSVEEIYCLKDEGKIPKKRHYVSGTIDINSRERVGTFNELNNLGELYNKGGELLVVMKDDFYGLTYNGLFSRGPKIVGKPLGGEDASKKRECSRIMDYSKKFIAERLWNAYRKGLKKIME